MPRAATRASSPLAVPDAERALLVRGEHHDPHAILGAHPSEGGTVVRAFHPDATSVQLVPEGGEPVAMSPIGDGLWAALLPASSRPSRIA